MTWTHCWLCWRCSDEINAGYVPGDCLKSTNTKTSILWRTATLHSSRNGVRHFYEPSSLVLNGVQFFIIYWIKLLLQVKIWFQNHRYKCKRQAKEKAMAEQNQHNQVRTINQVSFIIKYKDYRETINKACNVYKKAKQTVLRQHLY